ncbi:MAG: type IV secretion system DNA-binding domain-containing protein, partial [Sulfuriferula sp.]
IRLAYLGESQVNAKLQMQAIVGTFKQYNSTNLNGFKMASASYRKEDLDRYKARLFADKGFILNIEEVASVFHLPHTNVETPNIVWASTKTAEPPAKLPILTGNDAIDENISAFGLTNFRGINHQFGMLRSDRSRHMYIIGQTGAGKSGTLSLLALSDIYHNQGYAIIDPHGDFAIDNMKFIPGSRIKDVVYFNPADTAFPLGFNPLEISDPNMKSNISSELIGVLNRMFAESWGPRLEYILRYTLLALLDRPSTTMLDITRMLTDKKFRKETLSYSKDTVVLQFWNVEFASWTEKFQSEAIAPILNKVGAFTANPIIRNIIGQPKSTFNVRQIMDEGKILIVNLSKGLLGEDNSSILGALLVTKIQLAAMSRSDIPNIADRRPFYLYVDEFQNFATDSFATILSEARKYGLNLTVANQYTSQMSDTVRDAVFGNVGTMISFRISADDAPVLVKQFEPEFEANDLLQMNNRNFVMNMVINGEKVPAFSARTLQLPPPQADNTAAIVEYTRAHYSRTREDVERSINELIMPPEQLQRKGPGNPGFKMSQPETPALAKQWPIDDGAKPANNAQPASQALKPTEPNHPKLIIETPAGEAAIAGNTQPQPADGEAPAKRKRSRSRKRKPSGENGGEGESQHQQQGNSTSSPATSSGTPEHHKAPQPAHHAAQTAKPAHDPTKLSVHPHPAKQPPATQSETRSAPTTTPPSRPEPKTRDASLLKIR